MLCGSVCGGTLLTHSFIALMRWLKNSWIAGQEEEMKFNRSLKILIQNSHDDVQSDDWASSEHRDHDNLCGLICSCSELSDLGLSTFQYIVMRGNLREMMEIAEVSSVWVSVVPFMMEILFRRRNFGTSNWYLTFTLDWMRISNLPVTVVLITSSHRELNNHIPKNRLSFHHHHHH